MDSLLCSFILQSVIVEVYENQVGTIKSFLFDVLAPICLAVKREHKLIIILHAKTVDQLKNCNQLPVQTPQPASRQNRNTGWVKKCIFV